MLGLPAWTVELLIAVLQKTGLVSFAAALAAKGIVSAEQHIAQLKTYQEFPKGRNGV